MLFTVHTSRAGVRAGIINRCKEIISKSSACSAAVSGGIVCQVLIFSLENLNTTYLVPYVLLIVL